MQLNLRILVPAVLSSLVTLLFMYLDAKIFDQPKSKFTYFKGMVFVGSLVASLVYFMGKPSLVDSPNPIPGSSINPGTAMVNGTDQPMFTGMPNF